MVPSTIGYAYGRCTTFKAKNNIHKTFEVLG